MDHAVISTLGDLSFSRALDHPELLGASVYAALSVLPGADGVGVAEIDPEVADTAAFCERYGVSMGESANCVVVAGRREGETRVAACVILATTRADVNGVVRRRLDARKVSFAPIEDAVTQTGMEYGGITPIGLPSSWPVLADRGVVDQRFVVLGSGLRSSKLLVPGLFLCSLPSAEVIDQLGR